MNNLINEIPDATGLDGQRINSWKQFQEDEMASNSWNDVDGSEED